MRGRSVGARGLNDSTLLASLRERFGELRVVPAGAELLVGEHLAEERRFVVHGAMVVPARARSSSSSAASRVSPHATTLAIIGS